ncbi:unnamed protein product [Calypogeia fissa]
MGEFMVASLPLATAPAAAMVVMPTSSIVGGAKTVISSGGSCHSIGFRVDCQSGALCGKGTFQRRKSPLLAAPTLWGVQLPANSLAEHQYPKFVPADWRSKAHSKNRNVSLGTRVVAFLDRELHTVLELASDAELLDVSNILYGKSLLSPLLKSFTPGDGSVADYDGQPPKNQADRDALMVRLESRFLFLAADAKAVLSGRRPSYRNVLLQVRKKLQIPCPTDLSTEDIESEIFLHLLQQYSRRPTARPQASPQVLGPSSVGAKSRRRPVGLTSIMKLRGKELLSVVLKGGGAVTVSTLQRFVFRRLSGKLLVETARYQLAKEALVKTGQMAAMLETRVAVLAAKQGLLGAAKRYITVRSAMSILGPMLWGTLLADMLISAVGTDYARVVRAIYAFAQIRLVRAYNWADSNQVL